MADTEGKTSGKGKAPERVLAQRKELCDYFVNTIREMGGVAAWMATWKTGIISPLNGSTEKAYRGRNRFELALSAAINGYDDPRWLTFNQAKKLGLSVRKGAKSSIVEKWKTFSVPSKEQVQDTDGSMKPKFFYTFPKCVGYWCVFNASDIEGIAPIERTQSELDAFSAADRLIATSRCAVNEGSVEAALSGCGSYSPGRDVIDMAPRGTYADGNTFLHTLIHEMAHSTAVPLKREAKGRFGDDDYAFEELIAELTSAFVTADLGFSMPSDVWDDEFAKYLASWDKILGGDPDRLFAAAGKASAAADYIESRYNEAA